MVLAPEEVEPRFWSLIGVSEGEAANYVPQFFAAAIVGETPEAFGLDMEPLSRYASRP